MKFIMRIVASSIVVFGLSRIMGGIHVEDFWTAIALAVVLAILNAVVKPVLIILTLPFTLVSLGLFLFVINAGIILIADRLLEGFSVDGFWWALFFSLVLSLVTSLLYRENDREDRKDQKW